MVELFLLGVKGMCIYVGYQLGKVNHLLFGLHNAAVQSYDSPSVCACANSYSAQLSTLSSVADLSLVK